MIVLQSIFESFIVSLVLMGVFLLGYYIGNGNE